MERVGNQEETYFSYEELQRICMDAITPRAGSPLNQYLEHFDVQGILS